MQVACVLIYRYIWPMLQRCLAPTAATGTKPTCNSQRGYCAPQRLPSSNCYLPVLTDYHCPSDMRHGAATCLLPCTLQPVILGDQAANGGGKTRVERRGAPTFRWA